LTPLRELKHSSTAAPLAGFRGRQGKMKGREGKEKKRKGKWWKMERGYCPNF